MQKSRWKFWIDVGGTFTDCLACDPDGNECSLKVLSSGVIKGAGQLIDSTLVVDTKLLSPSDGFWEGVAVRFDDSTKEFIKESKIIEHNKNTGQLKLNESVFDVTSVAGQNVNYEIMPAMPAPVLGMHLLSRTPILDSLPDCDVYLGTTRGTNALLTRSGARTGFVTSKGLRDLLLIGDQTRPHLFELAIRKPEPLFEKAIEINERLLSNGTIEIAPDPATVKQQMLALKNEGIESVAICLMHGYRYPEHERIVGRIAGEIGFRDVRLSSDVAPLIKIVPRGETTVLDAYLNPVLGDYLDQIVAAIGCNSRIQLMTSAGSLASRERFSGKDSVLSGPAAGVVGAARIAQQAGFSKAIGFDMGGTSTDVSRFDGTFELEYESQKAGVNLMTPMMAIETVAAGGGSICWFDGTRLTVGPTSAGADPGPACYGRGGPLAITDINLILGRVDQRQFPFPLNQSAADEKLFEIQNQLTAAGLNKSTVELANGFLQIANHSMASAIRSVSVAKGFDPKDYLLVSFGGAGGQHCCGVADNLEMNQILIHPESSILSAVGIRLADNAIHRVLPVLKKLDSQELNSIRSWHRTTVKELAGSLNSEGTGRQEFESTLALDLRYQGTHNSITVQAPDDYDFVSEFSKQHQRLYGYVQSKREIEIVAARTTVLSRGHSLARSTPVKMIRNPESAGSQRMSVRGEQVKADLYDWKQLDPGSLISGPAVIGSNTTTVIVDAGWKAEIQESQQILMKRTVALSSNDNRNSEYLTADPVLLEIFNNSFRSIATQMGAALRNTSVSVNVKERLDFSCAVFCDKGNLVVNAPHIPVHLGAMSETVRETIRLNPRIEPGDVFVTNDPYAGGSHLPDVTVLAPVFQGDLEGPSLWVASRSHHAEIGGIAPGSMPAAATCLEQEGVLIQNFKLISKDCEYFTELRDVFTSAKFPSRTPDENIADIKAQVAANQSGIRALHELIKSNSWRKVSSYMEHIRVAAETKTRIALRAIADGEFEFADSMDDGTAIRVKVRKSGEQLHIDFTGTDPVHSGNLNANPAIVRSAVMYVMRCIIDEDIPLNDGVLQPIDIVLPECFLNPKPAKTAGMSPAVVGGNVETSQRVVDVLLGALGLAAASQGTMNNWLVGDDTFGYYETVGGGSGAIRGSDGADAVHCHMSNTRLTDPEVMETRYPFILREFAVRVESGGSGRWSGGNGMIRTVEFTKPLTLSVLGSRRTTSPFGLGSGGTGKRGENRLIRANGSIELLPSQSARKIAAGDMLRISTPGGGGSG